MKKKKKLLIAAGVIVVGCIGAYLFFSNQKPAPAQVQTAALKPTTLRSTVEASGLVESTDDANVYSEVAAPIKHVAVKAGDHVSAGQLLCELDDKDVQDTLKQKEIALSTGAQASGQKIKSAQKKYDQDRSTLSSGLNTQINTAKDQVVTAQRTLDDAKNK
ncbi:MAG TPA: secretion protein HlyD, partial [Ruminococcaceae bacterium]|nr:secretion protein HlyD [Oscillospiraceae bacterium]